MSNVVTKLFLFVLIAFPVAVFSKDESPYYKFSAKKILLKKQLLLGNTLAKILINDAMKKVNA